MTKSLVTIYRHLDDRDSSNRLNLHNKRWQDHIPSNVNAFIETLCTMNINNNYNHKLQPLFPQRLVVYVCFNRKEPNASQLPPGLTCIAVG